MHLVQYQASITLLFIQTIREDKRQGEWCFCVCVCVCVCVQLLDVTSTSAYAWKLQMNLAGCLFVFVHVCVCEKRPREKNSTPPKWPPRTDNKSLRDSPHPVQLGQSIDLSMALKVASSSPPTLRSHLLSQLNLVCFEWS